MLQRPLRYGARVAFLSNALYYPHKVLCSIAHAVPGIPAGGKVPQLKHVHDLMKLRLWCPSL
eukprot:4684270-Alexandrium_andersonii.AAC.1